ncbi:hypothetical protein Mapa_004024 [Marchantia paleacea]|nr:hypothetical protein Mapa_004024 [Marchantia paleacea]
MVVLIPEPKLNYKAIFFRHGVLIDELRNLRRHHTSTVNQLVHIVSMSFAFAFFSSTLVILGMMFTLPDPILIPLVILFFPLPYLAFFWYLDPVVFFFWLPLMGLGVAGSFPIAQLLNGVMPMYAAIACTFGASLLSLFPQLIGHYFFEKIGIPAFEMFELLLMTPFFLGYCGVGWITCWKVRKDLCDKIWSDGP